MLGWFLVLIAACGGSSQREQTLEATPDQAQSNTNALSVAQVVAKLSSNNAGDFRGVSVDLIAYVNPAPARQQDGGTRPVGCPIVPETLASLTDQPFPTEFKVAGVTLPNTLPEHLPALRLFIPYTLGMIDVPPHARLRGRFFDPEYASCPEFERLFILEEVISPLPSTMSTPHPVDVWTIDWATWHDPSVALGIDYPSNWTADAVRHRGAIVETIFSEGNADRVVRLRVLAGETHWDPTRDSVPPSPLAGNSWIPMQAGATSARLVDVHGDLTSNGRRRTVRVVLNYQDNTVVVSMRFVDGAELDRRLLAIFSTMVASLSFDNVIEISDPMDPTTHARSDLGPGPFIGEVTAADVALGASGLHDAAVVERRLVSEREAREAQGRTCREFPGRPDGVWLVLVEGVLPTGQRVQRLIYLDAETGESLCQAPA